MSSKEWYSTTIGDQLLLQRGYDITKAEQREGIIPVISSSGVTSYHNVARMKGPGVVLGRKGVVGSVHFVAGDYWPHDTTLFVKDFKGNHPRFVYYFFKWMSGILASMDVGSANPTLNRNHVHPISVQWPPLPEQNSISAILSCLDDIIELNNGTNQVLEEMAQAIFKHWFVDFEFPNEDGQPYKLRCGEMVESELGEIPNGWRVMRIGEFADVKGGKRLPKGHQLQIQKTLHPYIRITDLINGRVDIKNLLYINDDTYPFISKYKINKDDIFLSIVGTIGIVGIINEILDEANLTENMAKISHIQNHICCKHYLHYYLRSELGQHLISGRTVGSTQFKLALYRIKDIPVLIPSSDCMSKYDQLSRNLYTIIDNNELQNLTLTAIRDTLLPKIMSGEIRVPIEEAAV
ncbi:MAG TPA: restriction endonuclease subunit S [Syntrophomonadaceae bacterium]|nr:restriction endonuclease subunit S [Syntrophomonadaceae bacterium]